MPANKNDNEVSDTNDMPVKKGLAINRNENNMPNTLNKAISPQLTTFNSFRSKANPKSKKERNKSVNPTTKGNIDIEISG